MERESTGEKPIEKESDTRRKKRKKGTNDLSTSIRFHAGAICSCALAEPAAAVTALLGRKLARASIAIAVAATADNRMGVSRINGRHRCSRQLADAIPCPLRPPTLCLSAVRRRRRVRSRNRTRLAPSARAWSTRRSESWGALTLLRPLRPLREQRRRSCLP